jgi:hypothetical protein
MVGETVQIEVVISRQVGGQVAWCFFKSLAYGLQLRPNRILWFGFGTVCGTAFLRLLLKEQTVDRLKNPLFIFRGQVLQVLQDYV